MICFRKHHQCRVIVESIDSMNISHFELLSDLLIAFLERSCSMLRISTKAAIKLEKSINEGLINGSPQVFKKQLFRGVDELGHLDQNQFFKGIDDEVG